MFKHINKVVKVLVMTDFFVNSAFGSFAPIFAIFITGQIHNGSASVAGFATSVFWIVKSLVQLPVARFLDKTDGEFDDFWALFFGYLLGGLLPFGYLFVSEPWHLYVLQAFYGVCMAWAVPSWYAIFTRHVDKWRVSFEWSLQSVFSVGLATAIAAALGGYVVDRFGFNSLFIAAGTIASTSSLLLLGLRRHIFPKRREANALPEHRPHR
ncbi:MFS transporter [Candidatus Jorgensenbacteria bacterium]|nr:MFS transporter [Candidatus Jorgensenbacteria bacterium]